MKVEKESLDDRQVLLTVEVPPEKSKSALVAAARRLSRRSKIPGFRPGKVPYEIALRKFGEDAVFDEALDSMGPEMYRLALSEAEVEAFASGTFEKVVSRDPLVLRFTVPLAPEVVLGDYRSLRLDHEEPDVQDDAVSQVMEDLRQRQALIEVVDRPAEMSDVVVLDVTGELLEVEEGESPKLLDEKNVSVLVGEETDWPIPGIAEELIGLVPEDEKQIEYTFADDYSGESLRGRKATFHLTVREVKSRLVPEWSDDLARNLGEFEDLLDLRIKVREQLQEQAEREADSHFARQVIDAVVADSTVSYPPILLDQEIDDMVRDLERRLKQQNLTLEDYLKIEKKTSEDLRTEFEPSARKQLERALTMGKVIETEGIEIDPSEIEAEIERLVEGLGDQAGQIRQTFEHPIGQSRIREELLSGKVTEFLIGIAKGQAPEPEQAGEKTDEEPEQPSPDAKQKATPENPVVDEEPQQEA